MCCGKEIRALRFLANLMEKDPVMKVNFLKDLKDLLPGLPLRILKLKVRGVFGPAGQGSVSIGEWVGEGIGGGVRTESTGFGCSSL